MSILSWRASPGRRSNLKESWNEDRPRPLTMSRFSLVNETPPIDSRGSWGLRARCSQPTSSSTMLSMGRRKKISMKTLTTIGGLSSLSFSNQDLSWASQNSEITALRIKALESKSASRTPSETLSLIVWGRQTQEQLHRIRRGFSRRMDHEISGYFWRSYRRNASLIQDDESSFMRNTIGHPSLMDRSSAYSKHQCPHCLRNFSK